MANYQTIAKGVFMRVGTSSIATYPERTQREVPISRRDEAITYKVEYDTDGLKHRERDDWDHYTYRFTYLHLGRKLVTTWHCGTAYGSPKPEDGLASAFLDAENYTSTTTLKSFMEEFCYDGETERAEAGRIFNACAKMNDRLDAFFGSEWSREAWATAVHED